jgi:hypothetical protein
LQDHSSTECISRAPLAGDHDDRWSRFDLIWHDNIVLPDLLQVLTMKRDEIAEKLDVVRSVRRCRLLAIDPPLDIDAPFLRVLSVEKCLVDIFSLSSDLDPPSLISVW